MFHTSSEPTSGELRVSPDANHQCNPVPDFAFRVARDSLAISRVGINRLPRSPLRCRPTCQVHFSLATRWRTIHPGLHVNLPILGRNTPGTFLIIIPRVRRN
jgi:hypothetical protein